MSNNTITFNKEEFAILLKMTFIGETILHSTVDNKADMNAEVLAFKQKIYEEAKRFELGNWIDKTDPDDLQLMEAKEEQFMDDIYTYDEAIFWNNLIDKLVERDMIKKYNLGVIKQMDQREVMEKEEEFRTFYYQAFNKMGVKKLFLKK